MKAAPDKQTKPSEPEQVDAWIKALKHPLRDVVTDLRALILGIDKGIGEEIKWNHPTFFYGGPMKPSDPKLYKRYMIVFNVYRKDCVRLVFPSGAKIEDTSGLLEGDYADGRRLALFHSREEVTEKSAAMKRAIKKWLKLLIDAEKSAAA
jgi:hypothetical protein